MSIRSVLAPVAEAAGSWVASTLSTAASGARQAGAQFVDAGSRELTRDNVKLIAKWTGGTTAVNATVGAATGNPVGDPFAATRDALSSRDGAAAKSAAGRETGAMAIAIAAGVAGGILAGALLATVGAPALLIGLGVIAVGSAASAFAATTWSGGTLADGLRESGAAAQDPLCVSTFLTALDVGLGRTPQQRPTFNPLGIPMIIDRIAAGDADKPANHRPPETRPQPNPTYTAFAAGVPGEPTSMPKSEPAISDPGKIDEPVQSAAKPTARLSAALTTSP